MYLQNGLKQHYNVILKQTAATSLSYWFSYNVIHATFVNTFFLFCFCYSYMRVVCLHHKANGVNIIHLKTTTVYSWKYKRKHNNNETNLHLCFYMYKLSNIYKPIISEWSCFQYRYNCTMSIHLQRNTKDKIHHSSVMFISFWNAIAQQPSDAQRCYSTHRLASRVMHSSTNFQAPPIAVVFLWSCDKVYHKQEICLLLYFLGQIVTWQYNPNLLD